MKIKVEIDSKAKKLIKMVSYCNRCGTPFLPKSEWHRFCSMKCNKEFKRLFNLDGRWKE